jgi:hypothetical protein
MNRERYGSDCVHYGYVKREKTKLGFRQGDTTYRGPPCSLLRSIGIMKLNVYRNDERARNGNRDGDTREF